MIKIKLFNLQYTSYLIYSLEGPVLFICYMSNVIFKIDLVYTFVYNYFLCKATPFLQNEEKYLCGFKVKQNSNLNYLALHGGLSSITNSMFTRDLQKSNLVLIVRSIRMRPIIKYRLLLLLFSLSTSLTFVMHTTMK